MRSLALTGVVLCCCFSALGQVPVMFTATWDAPALPLTRECTPWTANLTLVESNLAYSVELPTTHVGWSFEIYQQALPGSSDTLNFSLGACGHRGEKSIIFIPPGTGGNGGCPRVETCKIAGSLTLTGGQMDNLLTGLWYLKATTLSDHHGAPTTSVRAQILPVDTDADGVPDFRDLCPETAPGQLVNSNGCSIEQIAPCDGPWTNHGNYLQALKQVVDAFEKDALISKHEAQGFLKSAAQSNCGKP